MTHYYKMGDGTGDLTPIWETNAGTYETSFINNQVGVPDTNSVLGSDLIYNGGFSTGTTFGNTGSGWVKTENDGTISYDSGGIKLDRTSGQPTELSMEAKLVGGGALTVSKGKLYQLTYDVLSRSGGTSRFFIWQGVFKMYDYHSPPQYLVGTDYIYYFLAPEANNFGLLASLFVSETVLDNITLKAVGDATGAVGHNGIQFK